MARLVQKAKATGHKILVVDDVDEVLESTKLILEKEGHEVETANNGQDGVEKVRSFDPHLLILDYFMPGMTGADVVKEVRPFNRDVQILLQTGYASEKPPREMLHKLDIQGYHDKTDGPDKLLLWVDVSLKSYRQVRMLWSLLKRAGLAPPEPQKTPTAPNMPAAGHAPAPGIPGVGVPSAASFPEPPRIPTAPNMPSIPPPAPIPRPNAPE